MKTVRDDRDRALVQGAYAQWRQAFRLRLAEQQYFQRLAVRAYKRWRARLGEMDRLENRGDQFGVRREKRNVVRCWELWKRELSLRKAESAMTGSVGLRVLATAFDAWRRRL